MHAVLENGIIHLEKIGQHWEELAHIRHEADSVINTEK